jgi:hypothetical protein
LKEFLSSCLSIFTLLSFVQPTRAYPNPSVERIHTSFPAFLGKQASVPVGCQGCGSCGYQACNTSELLSGINKQKSFNHIYSVQIRFDDDRIFVEFLSSSMSLFIESKVVRGMEYDR